MGDATADNRLSPDDELSDAAGAGPLPRAPLVAPRSARWYRWISVASMLGVLVVWEIVSLLKLYPPLFLPSPLVVAQTFYSLLVEPYGGHTLLAQTGFSLARVLVAFVLSVVTGVPLGLLMGRSKTLEAVINPFMQLYRPVPPLAFIPLLIVWFGIGELPKVLLIYMGTVPIIIMDTMAGVHSVKHSAILTAESLGATRHQILRYVVLPSVLPSIFVGMRVGIGIAWTCLVAAEMIAAVSGLGWMILHSSRYLRTDAIFVGILVIGICGVLMDGLLRWMEHRLIPWRGMY